MRWIIDTSAWSRLDRPEIADQIEDLLGDEHDEMVLSPAVELELMRGPQGGDAVAAKRQELEENMEVLPVDDETFALAAGAMERLAEHEPEGHRLPIPDLITAALAHQHNCCVVHIDGDFELLAEHSGLVFNEERVELAADDGDDGDSPHPAIKQRALKSELAQLVHRMPIDQAEEFLADVVAQARDSAPAVDAG